MTRFLNSGEICIASATKKSILVCSFLFPIFKRISRCLVKSILLSGSLCTPIVKPGQREGGSISREDLEVHEHRSNIKKSQTYMLRTSNSHSRFPVFSKRCSLHERWSSGLINRSDIVDSWRIELDQLFASSKTFSVVRNMVSRSFLPYEGCDK